MKYMQNSSEITLLLGRQLRLLVYQKMYSSRSSALQGVWFGPRIILDFDFKCRVSVEVGVVKAPQGEKSQRIRHRIEKNHFECISHTFKIQRSAFGFSSQIVFYRLKHTLSHSPNNYTTWLLSPPSSWLRPEFQTLSLGSPLEGVRRVIT